MDDKPGGVSFLDFIETNYYSQKSKLQSVCDKFNDFLFDEDVFHDTIIKVSEVMKDKYHTADVYEKYMMEAFKRNILREKLYHRNIMNDRICEFEEIGHTRYPNVESIIDLDIMTELIHKTFGEKLARFYMDWLSGYDIKEALEKHKIDSGYYHIKKINKFLKKHFEKEETGRN